MFKDLDKEEIEKLLHNELVGRIGCHADETTYVVPISYAYDGEFIYARSFEGKKLEMLRKNPKVCFQVDNTSDLSNWKSVICWGLFHELTKEEERQLAVHLLQNRRIPLFTSETMKFGSDAPYTNEKDVRGTLFRIHLLKKTGKTEICAVENYYST